MGGVISRVWLQERVVDKSWQPFQAEVQVQKIFFFTHFLNMFIHEAVVLGL